MPADEACAGGILTVDLGAIVENYRRLRGIASAAECAAVVKADAYGLGVAKVAPALAAAGCRSFFVATPDEGAALRRLLPAAAIYVLNGLAGGDGRELAERGLKPVLNSLGEIERWRARAGPAPLPAGLHFDTGMCRLGLPEGEVEALAAEPARLEGIAVELVMSHLACADEPGHALNREQRQRFDRLKVRLGLRPRSGAPPPRASLAASSGIFLGPDFHLEMVRPGAALYGLAPTPGAPNPMRQPFVLQGKILQVRDVDRGMTVGYGATHRFARPARLATVGAGYADGYLRALGNGGTAFVGDKQVPVVGRVSMDLITLDVTDVPPDRARPGDLVELIGPNIPTDAVAAAAGTIGYEILTSLGRRYARRYVGEDAAPPAGRRP